MRKGWTICVTVVALVTLNGCGLPPVVSIASYSFDIISYEATGKTVTDHVWSAVVRSDCSFVRVLKQKPICVDPPPADKTVAVQTAPATPSPHAKVAIGSFLIEDNAERSVARAMRTGTRRSPTPSSADRFSIASSPVLYRMTRLRL